MKTSSVFILMIMSFYGFSQSSATKDGIKFKLYSVIIKNDTLLFEMALFNRSLLGYTPQYVKFFIRDRHIVSRTAVQETEISPLISFVSTVVPAKSSTEFIFEFKQFTIPKTKELVIDMKERNGSRDLVLRIKGRRLLRMIKTKE